jgi:hypothetical protein
MSEIQEVGRALVKIKRILDASQHPHTPEIQQLRGALNRAIDRFRAFPDKVADQAPFLTAADAQVVLMRECKYVMAAFEVN